MLRQAQQPKLKTAFYEQYKFYNFCITGDDNFFLRQCN